MHSGYVYFCGNPSHKYGYFTPECLYAKDQGPLPFVVGLEKPGMRRGRKSLQCHIQAQDWRRGSAQFGKPSIQEKCNQKLWLYFATQGREYYRQGETYIQMEFMCFVRRKRGNTTRFAYIGLKLP